jgi:ubiquinone/menaquinone biosynthesis C-methylase UbiE
MTASEGRLAHRLAQRIAFGLAAGFYDRITDHLPWREDCRAMAELVPGPRVLDLGVGPGVSALEMARAARQARYVGLDFSAPMLRRARARSTAAAVPLLLVRGDVLGLPFGDQSFDGVTGHSILYLVPDAARSLAEARRVLRPGGRAAFLEPRAGSRPLVPAFADGPRAGVSMALWRLMSRLHRRYSEEDLAALLRGAGFREVRAWPVLGGLGVMASATRP